ncbi:uncharacterized protein BYT42DRAFT_313301 [Radiomyces spectabilis]|uniref:uncharacterized protein n=1 Tax=Radiomyces spectabilis TaxID=64574 RepID=UPI00221E62C6|nr:uncharacterized protein BYT42DRAFT_313301 [Radiomyces spectabilis]KAI8379108.1 hypothetical protein BYT42DRAFT_313301 [Radiomyces spectabilis]
MIMFRLNAKEKEKGLGTDFIPWVNRCCQNLTLHFLFSFACCPFPFLLFFLRDSAFFLFRVFNSRGVKLLFLFFFHLSAKMGSNTCESIQSQLSRLPKSKATASTTAIQPLEITTTAVVTSNGEGWEGRCDGNGTSEGTTVRPAEEIERRGELQRKQSHHHHHHHIKSPIFEAQNLQFNASVSPLVSPSAQETPSGATDSALSVLPSSPIIKGPSEAIAALQNAVNASKTKGASSEVSSKSLAELFESSFFSAVLLVQWSNVMGPKVERVWSNEPLDERLQQIIGRQVLNGEMGRTLASAEPKWVVLHRQGIVCTAFLYNDSTALCALILVVPVRYLRNFSQYFNVLCTCVPRQLVEPLVKLRKIHRRLAMTWIAALDYFASYRLVPFIRMIMELESVSLPTECVKIGHTILDTESKQMLDSLFIAKYVRHFDHIQVAYREVEG